jgi:hypothetical protein
MKATFEVVVKFEHRINEIKYCTSIFPERLKNGRSAIFDCICTLLLDMQLQSQGLPINLEAPGRECLKKRRIIIVINKVRVPGRKAKSVFEFAQALLYTDFWHD